MDKEFTHVNTICTKILHQSISHTTSSSCSGLVRTVMSKQSCALFGKHSCTSLKFYQHLIRCTLLSRKDVCGSVLAKQRICDIGDNSKIQGFSIHRIFSHGIQHPHSAITRGRTSKPNQQPLCPSPHNIGNQLPCAVCRSPHRVKFILLQQRQATRLCHFYYSISPTNQVISLYGSHQWVKGISSNTLPRAPTIGWTEEHHCIQESFATVADGHTPYLSIWPSAQQATTGSLVCFAAR